MVLSMAVPRVTYALARGEAGTPSTARWPLSRVCIPASALRPTQFCCRREWRLLVLMLGAFDRILAFIIFSAVVFLALTAATLFRTITPVAAGGIPWLPSFSSPAAECSPSCS